MTIQGFKLTKEEVKIYNAIMSAFPKTSKLSAIDAALAGGVKFNFIYK